MVVDEEDDEPLGLVDDDAPPPLPTLPDAEPETPLPDEDVPPVPPGVVVLELEPEPGDVGADDVVEEEDEPPGTTTVSFSLVVELVELEEPLGDAPPPGTTVVVSLRSHAASARAPIRTNT